MGLMSKITERRSISLLINNVGVDPTHVIRAVDPGQRCSQMGPLISSQNHDGGRTTGPWALGPATSCLSGPTDRTPSLLDLLCTEFCFARFGPTGIIIIVWILNAKDVRAFHSLVYKIPKHRAFSNLPLFRFYLFFFFFF